VVVVPQSFRAPHQASDKRFYKRFNFQSVAMEEYEIRDVSRRAEAPDLSLSFDIVEWSAEEGNEQTSVASAQLEPIIRNESATPAEYVVINIFIDSRLDVRSWSGLKPSGAAEMTVSGRGFPCSIMQMNHAIPGKIPIFQGVHFRLLNAPIAVGIPGEDEYGIGWALLSPRMRPKSGASLLVWDGCSATLRASGSSDGLMTAPTEP
jgi:hypothetical protein